MLTEKACNYCSKQAHLSFGAHQVNLRCVDVGFPQDDLEHADQCSIVVVDRKHANLVLLMS